MMDLPLTTLAALLALCVYFWTLWQVGQARGAHKVPPPATTGPPAFERTFRAQMNTLEQMVLFMPALFIGALALGDVVAGICGLVWSVGRVVYFLGYVAEAKRRTPGFLITILASGVLILGSLGATLWRMAMG
jgi:glutathione S-transferase